MFESRDLRVDLAAIVLAVSVLFLSCAVFTHDPADRCPELPFPFSLVYHPDPSVYPAHDVVNNAVGPLGAIVSDALLRALGWGTYYLLATLLLGTIKLFVRRHIRGPVARVIGWLTSLCGLTALLSMMAPQLSTVSVMGAGGYVGELCRSVLQHHFAVVGGFMIALALLGIGLLLCTDYVLIQLLVLLGVASADRVVTGTRRLARRPRAARRKEMDRTVTDEDAMSIRIGGRKVESIVSDDLADVEEEIKDFTADDEDGYEYESDETEADEEQPSEELVSSTSGETGESEPTEEDSPTPVLLRTGKRRRLMSSKRGKKREAGGEVDREQVMQQLDEASQTEDERDYELPSCELLIPPSSVCLDDQVKEVRRKAKVLEATFSNFGFDVKVVDIETGPVIAQYEVELEAGLRLSKITGLADDLAIALRVPSVRIVAPIPGKNTVGIEVPNSERQVVRLREVMDETNGRIKKMRIPLFLGKDVSGNPLTVDLSTLPHLLIAGRTGTGKSVCLNAIISSILMTRRPDEVRMLMIDPKMVELSGYKSLPHLMHPVVTDMRKAEAILAWAVEKMEERYSLLARAGVRHVSVYNQLGEEELMERLEPESDEERQSIPLHMPYVVIVADEMADLMMTSGKEVEQHIIRLAQKSRAVGIHLILATQKPTVDVITGLIKSNLPARIAFQVASRTDSRVVLDEMGAEKLLGSGDMLFLWPGTSTLLRGQGTYLGDDEINRIVDSVSTGEQDFLTELVQLKVEDESGAGPEGKLKKRDDLYEDAVDVVVREGRGSVSLLQRALGIGYGRAARLIDFMAEDGIVGSYAGSQAREVLISLEDWKRMQGETSDTASEAAAASTQPISAAASHGVAAEVDEEGDEAENDDFGNAAHEGQIGSEVEDEEDDEEYEYVEVDEADGEYEVDEYEEDEDEVDEYEEEPEEEYDDEEDATGSNYAAESA